MEKISTNSQIADLFTKQLTHQPFARHRHSLGIQLPNPEKGSVVITRLGSRHPESNMALMISGMCQVPNGNVSPLVKSANPSVDE
jgi:hypothetical protein